MGENYKPLLSVIITAYNREKFLEECIYSIRQQTYKNLEILIIDDCSTDNTEKLIKNIQQDDERIKYMKYNINKGAGAAKNTGIEQATGKYITFVDSDDKLANIYAYETAIKSFEKNNIDVYVYMQAKQENILINKKYKKYKIDSHNIYKATTMIPLKVFKAEQIKKVRNNEKIKFDDIPFWVDFCLTNRPIIYQTYNEFYILNECSISITRNEKNYLELFDAYIELEKILNDKGKNIKDSKSILYKILNGNLLDWYNKINDTEIKEEYRRKAKEYIKKLDSTLGIIGNGLNLKNMALFIDDETARNKYLQDIEIFRDNAYRYIKPNKILFKIQREIKRIVYQIKNLLISQ